MKIVPPADPNAPGIGSFAQDDPETHASMAARPSAGMSVAELATFGLSDAALAELYDDIFERKIVIGDDAHRRAVFDAVMSDAMTVDGDE